MMKMRGGGVDFGIEVVNEAHSSRSRQLISNDKERSGGTLLACERAPRFTHHARAQSTTHERVPELRQHERERHWAELQRIGRRDELRAQDLECGRDCDFT